MIINKWSLVCIFFVGGISGCGGGDNPQPPIKKELEFGLEKAYQPPELSGNFNVGTRVFHWKDTSRDEPHTQDESDTRELLARVFYPAEVGLEENRLPVFDSFRWSFWFDAGNNVGNKRLRISNYTSSYWPIYNDAIISEQQGFYPLIVLSHGYGFSPEEHVYLAAEFASRGYIVVSINHPYGSSRAVFPDGREVLPIGLPQDNLGQDMELWAQDQVFVIQQMEELNQSSESFLFAKIDMSKVITTGHSYGGGSSFHSAWLDDRVKLAIDIDGTIFNLDDREIDIPFMYIQSHSNDGAEIFEHVLNDGYSISFEHRIDHHSFADYVMFWQSDFPDVEEFGPLAAERAMLATVDIMEQFINKYLHQQEAPLLDDSEQAYDFVRIRFFDN